MRPSSLRPLALAFACASLPLLTNTLTAQIPIGGVTTGTLTAGVYVTTASIVVPAGQILSLSPGVIIKFTSSGHEVTVDGTLVANGISSNKVILTAYADDSAGGDTNGNGPSNGASAAWRGIVFSSTASASALTWAEIRYGGGNYVSNLELNSANPVFLNCVVRNCYTHGLDLNGNSFPTVHNCTFADNGGRAIESVPFAALPGFANNLASGNNGNYARVTVGTMSQNQTLATTQMLGGAFTVDTTVTVPAGMTLSCDPGVVVKLMNAGVELTVNGTLLANGSPGNRVVFTDDADDSAGGDTNGNGPSNGAPTAWRGIVFHGSGTNASVLDHTDVRYGGANYVSNVELDGANPTLTNCELRNCYTHGLDLNGISFPTVQNCTFTGNGGHAVESVPIAAVPGFANNTASGNNGNYTRVTVGAIGANVHLGTTQLLGGAVMIDTSLVIASGASLTLDAGVVLKLMNPGVEITVDGTLQANGVSGNPVVFTDDADDSAGGDTNGNGPSNGAPTAWRGIVFNPTSSACSLSYADVRYGGANYVSNLELNAANPVFSHCIVRNCYTHGMDLNLASRPTVSDCTFTNNGGRAVEAVALAAVPGFTNNTATGNVGNYLHVTNADVTGALKIGPQSILQGALMMGANVHVLPAGVLTVEQGVNFKFESQYEVTVEGSAFLRGTGYEPIVFTSAADDSVAGDTNGNGPSSGSPANWRGVTFTALAQTSLVEDVIIRYTGGNYVPGLTSASPFVTLRAVRVDRSYDRGFLLQTCAGAPANLVAWSCGGYGIHLTGDSFQLVHATSTGNGTGIRRDNAWTGNVVNSISYANNTNFFNFGTGTQVLRSNGGFAGSNGNLNVDPQFVSAATGDLHLTPGSPCLGAADLYQATLVQKDFDENSRMLDHALTGLAFPDMGAFELPAWDMTVTGVARPGSTVTFTIVGPPGQSFLALGLVDGAAQFLPWGMLLAGQNPGSSVVLLFPTTIPTGFPIPLTLANDSHLLGITAGIQSLTFPAAGFGAGNFTRLYHLLIRP
jgi:hypothetical protein